MGLRTAISIATLLDEKQGAKLRVQAKATIGAKRREDARQDREYLRKEARELFAKIETFKAQRAREYSDVAGMTLEQIANYPEEAE